jgi:arylsulfatase A-like enzyme
VAGAWEVLNKFTPELTVLNTTNLDICHSNFTGYLNFLHRADYGIGWLWDKIQSHPVLANDTIMVCIPEHGRNLMPNNLQDGNGLLAFDHTSDANSRRLFSLIVGPDDKVIRQTFGDDGVPTAESVDIVPTIAHILGFHDDIPNGILNGRALTEAFV